MEERDQASTSGAGRHELASEVGERVQSIISAAESAANALREEADREAAARRRMSEEEGQRIIEDAKADADAYLAERTRMIGELSDGVVERAETIVSRLDRAQEVRQQLQTLADALGESAERLASEVRIGTPPPTVRSPSGEPVEGAPEQAPPPPASEDLVAADAPVGGVESAPPEAFQPGSVTEQIQPGVEEPAPPAFDEAPPVGYPPEGEAAVEQVPPLEGDQGMGAGGEEATAEPGVVPLGGVEQAPAEGARRDADQQLGARLVALQMAVAGGNRGEVEVHLRRTFELADPSSILDDVFGQGTDSEKRVAWPRNDEGAA